LVKYKEVVYLLFFFFPAGLCEIVGDIYYGYGLEKATVGYLGHLADLYYFSME